MKAIRKDVFGWFDAPGQTTPVHDPGFNTICPVCACQLCRPVMTISLMPVFDQSKSYFFRVHKGCWETTPEQEKALIESSLIDALRITGESPNAQNYCGCVETTRGDDSEL
jgi:hypothetical protein